MLINRAIAIGLIGFTLGAGGCLAIVAGAAAGAGTYLYLKGELTDTEEVPLDRAYEAAKAAVKDLEYRTKEQSKDALQARIVALEADGTEVHIKMESKGEKLTKFTVRIGVVGDESRSRLIMDKIKKHL